METKDIVATAGIVLTILLSFFFWITVWVVTTELVGWYLGLFVAILGLVGFGALAAWIITRIADWAEFDL